MDGIGREIKNEENTSHSVMLAPLFRFYSTNMHLSHFKSSQKERRLGETNKTRKDVIGTGRIECFEQWNNGVRELTRAPWFVSKDEATTGVNNNRN